MKMNIWERGFSFSRLISPVYSLITQTRKRCPISSCKVISRGVPEFLIHATVRKKKVHQNGFSSTCNSTCITFADWFQTCSAASGFSMAMGEEKRMEKGTHQGDSREGRQKRKTAEKKSKNPLCCLGVWLGKDLAGEAALSLQQLWAYSLLQL